MSGGERMRGAGVEKGEVLLQRWALLSLDRRAIQRLAKGGVQQSEGKRERDTEAAGADKGEENGEKEQVRDLLCLWIVIVALPLGLFTDAFKWFPAGGMLGASVKGREADLKSEQEGTGKTYGQADGKGAAMAAKRGKSGVPQAPPRSELRVFRAGSSEGRLPVPTNLRKQKSLTNLAVLTDAEKKRHLYQPEWCDDMAKPGSAQLKGGKARPTGGGGGGAAQLSRSLSKSEHSLFQGKPKPFSPLAAPSALGKQSRIPRGPYAEVKPISKAPEDSKSDDEILSSKAKANGKKVEGTTGELGAKSQADEGDEGEKPFLKVDPELVVTVLGDLEQLLFSQMLGEYCAAVDSTDTP
ncbi:hypothetical protein GN956_G2141 [Arapaima gigas]